MKSLHWFLTGSSLFFLAATAVGQSNSVPPTPPNGGISSIMIASPSLGGGASHGVRSVKGSPFSADVVYEFTQVLGDENRIHRESHGKIVRDGAGRVRNEMENELPQSMNMQYVTIQDPDSQTFVMLQPQFKRAVVNHITVHTDGAGRAIGIGQPVDSSGNSLTTQRLEQLKAMEQTPRPVAGALGKKFQKEELGTKEIEGFTASGIRYSATTPAGEIGNEKPIVTVNETWWCEELKAVLVSVHDDPQSGRRVMRLTNIQLGEPDSQLFQIPTDYTVQEFPAKPKPSATPPQ